MIITSWFSRWAIPWARYWATETLIEEFGVIYIYQSIDERLLGSVQCDGVEDDQPSKVIPSIYLGDSRDMDNPSISEYAKHVTRAFCLPDDRYQTLLSHLFPDNNTSLTVTEIAYSVMKPYKDRLLCRSVKDLRDISADENLYVAIPPELVPNSLTSSGNNTIIFEQILSLLARESGQGYRMWNAGELDYARQIYKSKKNVGSLEVDVSVDQFNNGAIVRRVTHISGRIPPRSSAVGENGGTEEGSQCAICLDGQLSVNKSTLPCGHSFHDPCIRLWLEDTCPICRAEYTRIGVAFVV